MTPPFVVLNVEERDSCRVCYDGIGDDTEPNCGLCMYNISMTFATKVESQILGVWYTTH